MRKPAREAKIRKRVEQLCKRLPRYLRVFEAANRFTGPSLYFHRRAIARRSQVPRSRLAQDKLFTEYVYATLASWGMHRMGAGGAKLVSFKQFADSLRQQAPNLTPLQSITLEAADNRDLEAVWNVLRGIKVSATRTILVASSKALHHFLPRLVPPIDREYTLWFFGYWDIGGHDRQIFERVFPLLHEVAVRCRTVIHKRIGAHPWYTGSTKVLDCALVGYVLKELS